MAEVRFLFLVLSVLVCTVWCRMPIRRGETESRDEDFDFPADNDSLPADCHNCADPSLPTHLEGIIPALSELVKREMKEKNNNHNNYRSDKKV